MWQQCRNILDSRSNIFKGMNTWESEQAPAEQSCFPRRCSTLSFSLWSSRLIQFLVLSSYLLLDASIAIMPLHSNILKRDQARTRSLVTRGVYNQALTNNAVHYTAELGLKTTTCMLRSQLLLELGLTALQIPCLLTQGGAVSHRILISSCSLLYGANTWIGANKPISNNLPNFLPSMLTSVQGHS